MIINYKWMYGIWVEDDFLLKISTLYSEHYGVWSTCSPTSPTQPIKLSPTRIKEWLSNENSKIYYAESNGELIGYAIVIIIKEHSYGYIPWVTQLVVHKDYRQKDIAKILLFSIWGLSDDFAWGIISSSPYAIRALEKATRRRCTPIRIKKNIRKLMKIGQREVPYVNEQSEIVISNDCSKINTEFFVDHSSLNDMLASVTSKDIPWLMGTIDEGWEWFAFTFKDQAQIKLTPDEIEKMVKASDQITQQAYSRMQLSEEQRWMSHTPYEVDFIKEHCKLVSGQQVIVDVVMVGIQLSWLRWECM